MIPEIIRFFFVLKFILITSLIFMKPNGFIYHIQKGEFFMIFPCLGIFLLVIIFIAANTFRTKQRQKELFDHFLQKENEANQTRRQSLDTLSYIDVPLERFPLGRYEAEIFSSYETSLCTLSQTKMLNLNGQTNTDLKLKYGVANLDTLLEYEKNFNHFGSDAVGCSIVYRVWLVT